MLLWSGTEYKELIKREGGREGGREGQREEEREGGRTIKTILPLLCMGRSHALITCRAYLAIPCFGPWLIVNERG